MEAAMTFDTVWGGPSRRVRSAYDAGVLVDLLPGGRHILTVNCHCIIAHSSYKESTLAIVNRLFLLSADKGPAR
jgi:hypothetical protein